MITHVPRGRRVYNISTGAITTHLSAYLFSPVTLLGSPVRDHFPKVGFPCESKTGIPPIKRDFFALPVGPASLGAWTQLMEGAEMLSTLKLSCKSFLEIVSLCQEPSEKLLGIWTWKGEHVSPTTFSRACPLANNDTSR